MHTVSRVFGGLFLAWVILALTACGGGGGGGSPPPTSQNASVTYSSGTLTFTVGTAITGVPPTITGSLSSFAISPRVTRRAQYQSQ